MSPGGSPDNASVHPRGLAWSDIAWLMLSDIVGTSVLTFSGVTENLGWVPTIAVLVGVFPLSLYVSVLMARTRRLLVEDPTHPYPAVGSMGAVARCAFPGPYSGTVVEIGVYGYTLLGQASYMLILGTSLQRAFYAEGMCLPTATLFGGLALFVPVCWLRNLSDSVAICFVNTLLIIVVVVLALAEVAMDTDRPKHDTHLFAPGLSFSDFLGSATNVIYSYAGQWMYFEMMETMTLPGDFPRAFLLSGPIMVSIYLVVALLGYYVGVGHDDLVAGVPRGPVLRVVAVLLLAHVAIVYLIKNVVLARYLHSSLWPRDSASRWKHCLLCGCMLLFCFLVANALPFFSQLMGLIGGLFAGPINFVLPIGMYLAVSGRRSYETCNARATVEAQTEPAGGGVACAEESLGADGGAVAPSPECHSVRCPSGATLHPLDGADRGASLLDQHAPQRRRHGAGPEMFATAALTLRCSNSCGQRASANCNPTTVQALWAGLCSAPHLELVLMILIVALTVVTMFVGVAAEIRQIAQLQDREGAPFSCHPLLQ